MLLQPQTAILLYSISLCSSLMVYFMNTIQAPVPEGPGSGDCDGNAPLSEGPGSGDRDGDAPLSEGPGSGDRDGDAPSQRVLAMGTVMAMLSSQRVLAVGTVTAMLPSEGPGSGDRDGNALLSEGPSSTSGDHSPAEVNVHILYPCTTIDVSPITCLLIMFSRLLNARSW